MPDIAYQLPDHDHTSTRSTTFTVDSGAADRTRLTQSGLERSGVTADLPLVLAAQGSAPVQTLGGPLLVGQAHSTTGGNPLREYTRVSDTQITLGGGDYRDEFTDYMDCYFTKAGGCGRATIDYSSYDSGANATTIYLFGGDAITDAAGLVVLIPQYGLASGFANRVSGGSSAFGMGCEASGQTSHAEGEKATASGQSSHAEGRDTTASYLASHAEGRETTASEQACHAEGYNTIASLDAAHAEGRDTTASGYVAHAEGGTTDASGSYSHAEGYETVASNDASHAQGRFATATKQAQHAHASGHFADPGDAQRTETVLWRATSNASATELTLSGAAPSGTSEYVSSRYILATSKTYACDVTIAARKSDGQSAMFSRRALIKNVGGTVSLEGSVQTIGTDINPGSWSVALQADNANKSLQIMVTGAASTNIRWVATVRAIEIKY